MTKKDYVRAAKLIRIAFEHERGETREDTIYRLFMSETVGLFCTFFSESPGFEASKFEKACYDK
jgi:hypothetical protein